MPPTLPQSDATLHETLGFAPFPQSEIYELSGAERKKFLNSYNTQDIQGLPENSHALGAFLTQKGKVVSDSLILVLADKILLLFSPGYGAKVKKHLDTFLMFSAVEFEDRSPQWSHFALFGPKAGAWLREHLGLKAEPAADSVQVAEFHGAKALAFQTQRLGLEAWEILVPAKLSAPIAESLSGQAVELDPATLEILRVEAGLPKIGVDMGEENLVAEVGLDKRATSFNKGCYLGQETTARVDSRGHVNRNLVRVKLSAPPPAALPAEIFQGEKKIGALSSAVPSPKFAGWIGLAMVASSAWEHPEPLQINAETGKIEVKKL
jgi:folate-binding protein YgfZ